MRRQRNPDWVPMVGALTVLALLLMSPTLGAVPAPAHPPGAPLGPDSMRGSVQTATCPALVGLTIAASPTSGVAPLHVTFSSNVTGGCAPFEVEWEFGDGAETQGATVNHTFRGAGTFDVYARVTDGVGANASNRTAVQVSGGSGGLLVTVTLSPSTGSAPFTVTAWANLTGGNVSQADSVAWTFGDGGNGSGTPISHIYSRAGTFTARATATAQGSVASGSATVVVTAGTVGGGTTNLSLLATPATAHPPANVTVTAFSNGANPPYNLSICFGDASACVTGPSKWDGSAPALATHQYNRTGKFSVEGTLARPGGGVIASASVLVFLTAGGPLVVHANASVPTGGVPSRVTFVSSVIGGTPPYSIQWSFGDGTLGSSAPGASVTHAFSSAGTFYPWLLVEDSAGNRRNVTFSPVHVAPSSSLGGLPGTFAGVPTVGVILLLAAASVVVGVGVGIRSGRRSRERERAKEGEELVRELEERR